MNLANPPSERRDLIAELIKQAGTRAAPSPALEEKVRATVYAEWRRSLRSRQQRRAAHWLAAAAVSIFAVTLGWRLLAPAAPVEAATLAFSQGDVRVNATVLAHEHEPAALYSDDKITTGDGGARLTLTNGATVRMAANSALRWRGAPEKIELLAGALYIDSGPQHASLRIVTAHGVVANLGTRYQVRSSDRMLRVGVRDGRVQVANSNNVADANAGQEMTLDTAGQITRRNLPSYGEAWAWADALAPRFNIDNQSLHDFLVWAASETGRTLEYADTATSDAARAIVLHGSSAAFSPQAALDAVLPTTDFAAHNQGNRLVISKATPQL